MLPPDMKISDYDFLDFGSSDGASLAWGKEELGGKRGLGIDSAPYKVEEANKRGHESICASLLDIDLPDDCVDFVIISHLLEHLPGYDESLKVVETAMRVARDFVCVRGPWFDADDYLRDLGFKFYWSDWTNHTFHLTTSLLEQMLVELDASDYTMMGKERISSTLHHTIHPLSAPNNQMGYKKEHGYRASFEFPRPLFRDMVCIVSLRDFERKEEVLNFTDGLEHLEDLVDDEHPHGAMYSMQDRIDGLNTIVNSMVELYVAKHEENETTYGRLQVQSAEAKKLYDLLKEERAMRV
ncbi:MAG: class I SAM-dependent methyltransferase [Pseudomonadota bacterium]